MPAFSEEAQFTFRATANTAQSLKYWYDDAYASEFTVAPAARDPPMQSAEGIANPVITTPNMQGTAPGVQEKETKSKKRKAEGEATSAKKKVCNLQYLIFEIILTFDRAYHRICNSGKIVVQSCMVFRQKRARKTATNNRMSHLRKCCHRSLKKLGPFSGTAIRTRNVVTCVGESLVQYQN